jgi:hypothetical protein
MKAAILALKNSKHVVKIWRFFGRQMGKIMTLFASLAGLKYAAGEAGAYAYKACASAGTPALLAGAGLAVFLVVILVGKIKSTVANVVILVAAAALFGGGYATLGRAAQVMQTSAAGKAVSFYEAPAAKCDKLDAKTLLAAVDKSTAISVLNAAILKGNNKMVHDILKYKAPKVWQQHDGITPLFAAILSSNYDILPLLCDKKSLGIGCFLDNSWCAWLSATNVPGAAWLFFRWDAVSPLTLAIQKCDARAVKIILDAGKKEGYKFPPAAIAEAMKLI